jgi:threonine/homoserine/homoserine lactone efflux protein
MFFTPEVLLMMTNYILGVMSPGADYVLIIRNSSGNHRIVGFVTALGLGAGIFIHNTYSILGFGLFLNQYPLILKIIKYIGACYLAYIAFQCFRVRPSVGSEKVKSPTHSISAKKGFRMGFLTQITNANASLFIITLFADVTDVPVPNLMLCSIILAACTVAWYGFVAFVLTYPRFQTKFNHYKHWINWASGACLTFFAIRLVLS